MLGQQAADRLRFASKPQTAFYEGCSLLRNFRLRLMGVPPIFLQEKDSPLANKFAQAALFPGGLAKLCTQKNTKSGTKYLRSRIFSCILAIAVTLIAMKREVAARRGRFSVERMSS